MATMHREDDLLHDMREEFHDLTHFSSVSADRQGRLALWLTFMALPLLWGLDMIFDFMNTNWEGYVAVWANNFLPGDAGDAITWVGIALVACAVLVMFLPHTGGDVMGIVFALLAINLISIDGAAHLVAGMVALALCAFAMGRMARGDHAREV